MGNSTVNNDLFFHQDRQDKNDPAEIKVLIDITDPNDTRVVGTIPHFTHKSDTFSWIKKVFGFKSFVKKKDNDLSFVTEDNRRIQTIDAYAISETLKQENGYPLEDDLGF